MPFCIHRAFVIFAFVLTAVFLARLADAAGRTVRIGLQKYGKLIRKPLLRASTGAPAPLLERALERQGYGVVPLTGDVVKSQQNIADTFYALGLLPKPVTVSEAVWKPGS